MSENFKIPRGTNDLLPDESVMWQALEQKARKLMHLYNYKEIRTPIFEATDLFARSMGQTSDVVQKQMLNLTSQKLDANGNVQLSGLSLRPENTASVVRSYIQNSLHKKERLSRLFYIGPMFRGERPQKGRLRQFHQIGVEAIGPESADPFLDAEVIALSGNLLKAFGVKHFEVKINSLGTLECKQKIQKRLREKISGRVDELCPDCQDRYARNVFRVLDCKNSQCQTVVRSIGFGDDWLDDKSHTYYQSVKNALEALDVPYREDPTLVRGLDYYTHTVFEVVSRSLGSQDALGAGGRYNYLVSQLGGPQVDATGFALGVERILLAQPESFSPEKEKLDLYVIAVEKNCLQSVFPMVEKIRRAALAINLRLSVETNYQISSMKSQMRAANKKNARFVAIWGADEERRGALKLKNMKTGQEQDIPMEGVEENILRMIAGTRETES
jgi:histidyl-tRNA synthetase